VRVIPLAADSLGVRSMATYVEAGDLRLLIDPGATVAPLRFGLGPTPEEEEALARAMARIEAYAVRADLVTVSHYHGDHYRLEPRIFTRRRVWAKDPRHMLDARQAASGRAFWAAVGPHATLERAEGRVADVRGVPVRVSPPLPHGPEGSGFGFVVAVTVDDGRRFVHAADVLGPVSLVATAYLIRERPDLVYLSGPPAYLETPMGRDAVRRGVDNLVRLVGETGCQVIVDHHAVRDRRYRERLGPAFATGRVVTVAEYLGRPERCLETRRPEHWAQIRRRARLTTPRVRRMEERP
jgi:hypothetical protein